MRFSNVGAWLARAFEGLDDLPHVGKHPELSGAIVLGLFAVGAWVAAATGTPASWAVPPTAMFVAAFAYCLIVGEHRTIEERKRVEMDTELGATFHRQEAEMHHLRRRLEHHSRPGRYLPAPLRFAVGDTLWTVLREPVELRVTEVTIVVRARGMSKHPTERATYRAEPTRDGWSRYGPDKQLDMTFTIEDDGTLKPVDESARLRLFETRSELTRAMQEPRS